MAMPGKEQNVRRVAEELTCLFDHRSPARRRRRNAEAEERKRRFGQDGARHAERRLNDQRLDRVRQNVRKQDPHIARAERLRGLDEIVFADLQHLPAHHARVADPADDARGGDELALSGAEKRDQGDGEQQAGKREKTLKT